MQLSLARWPQQGGLGPSPRRRQERPAGQAARTVLRLPMRPYHLARRPADRAAATAASAAGAAPSGPERPVGADSAILALTDSLRLLETERDEAVSTAESCARTAVKLEEMGAKLEQLALAKVSEGDEAGARQVLQEKSAVQEVLARTSARAQTNFTLAAKLAEKIGQQQAELMALLGPGGGGGGGGGGGAVLAAAAAAAAAARPPAAGAGGSASASAASTSGGAGPPPPQQQQQQAGAAAPPPPPAWETPWERSLAEARERIRQEEEAAAAAGRRASWQARETVEEARERLRAQAVESVSAAQGRARAGARESIEEARARIAAEDAAVLARVRELVARYRAGQYVPDHEIDWAFRQLETRAWR